MSIVLSAGIQAALAAVSPALHDSKHIGWVLGLLGCGSTLVTAVLSLAYTSQSFHIARSKRELLPVAAVTARFTDDADSVIASEPDDTSRGLLGGVETGGYGSLSQAFSLDDDGFGADEGAAGYQPQALTPGVDGFPVDGDDSGAEAETRGAAAAAAAGGLSPPPPSRGWRSASGGLVTDFKPVDIGSARAASSAVRDPPELKPIAAGPRTRRRDGLRELGRRAAAMIGRGRFDDPDESDEAGATPVFVAGPHIDDREEVLCCQCLCCRQQCVGFACGSKHTACGRCLSWCSGLCYFAVTPVISLPFLTFLLASLALTLAESPLPWLENQRFHPDDDVLEAISPAAATTGTSSGNGQLPPNAADLRLTAYLEAGFAALLVQAVVYMAASVAYAALLAEMPSFRVFRTAFPFLCGLALAAGIVFYDANRSETTSTVIVDAIQVLCFITVQYLRWFLLAAVPESLYGLLTIAIGVGVTVIGAAESRIIPWNELVTVVTMQAALLLAAGTSVLVSVWARDWLTGAVPTAHPHGATPLMQTAGLVGYGAAAPTRRPEAVVGGGPDELFGRDPPTEPTPASSATSLSGYHFSAAE